MTKKNDSLIVAILDRSGSMNGLEDDVIGGFNQLIEDQKKVEGTAKVTLVLFDSVIETPISFEDIQSVKPLTKFTYYVRGSTALLEAVGTTIDSVGDSLRKMSEDERPEHVIVMVFTDGMENASPIQWTRERVADMVREQTEKWNWTFMFLGANQDSWATASSIGFTLQSATFDWSHDRVGTQSAYRAASVGTAQARSGAAVDLSNITH